VKRVEPRPIRSFEDLECWEACRNLRRFIAGEVVPALAEDERYRLGDQLLRAARSATANVAEGYGRFHYLDNAKFCSNARGSCWEVLDHLITGGDESLISHELVSRGRELVDHALRLLNGYMNYLKRVDKPLPPEQPITHNH
jgi:four helix bundle protein